MIYKIDLQKIANELDFDLEDVEMIIEAFLEDAKDNLKKLKLAIDSNDMKQIILSSHSIKGSAANILLTDIVDIAQDIENNSSKNINTNYIEKYTQLKKLIEDLYDD